MAQAPRYKVYSASGEYVASFKYPGDAAVLLAIGYPNGGTVRLGHGPILYKLASASDSYDAIAADIIAAEVQVHRAGYRAAYGKDPD